MGLGRSAHRESSSRTFDMVVDARGRIRPQLNRVVRKYEDEKGKGGLMMDAHLYGRCEGISQFNGRVGGLSSECGGDGVNI